MTHPCLYGQNKASLRRSRSEKKWKAKDALKETKTSVGVWVARVVEGGNDG
jgi:hypothetical protein